ncbi:tubulin-tyrosine ligase family protein [Nitzschia inconspicua]|uniref:Tubulin-tyrosine ligase family protein n=1 Tax=Nitzschia inconspicua TaxID=303405 RepID=A0A9K3M4Y9_9STRA|nr:tubulin-tyrosine ligase family protein [Nitzschia inconspicua]
MRRRTNEEVANNDRNNNDGNTKRHDGKRRLKPSSADKVVLGGLLTVRELLLTVSSNIVVVFIVYILVGKSSWDGLASGGESIDGGLAKFLETSQRRPNKGHPRDPKGMVEPSPPRMVTPVPVKMRKTFYYDGEKISFPVARAFRSRGWQRVDEIQDAHLIYTYKQWEYIGRDLEPYQRFNLIPNADRWNSKWSFVKYQTEWEQLHNKRSVYIPESYMLTDSPEQTDQFEKRLSLGGGAKFPWLLKAGDINQGKGITVLAPNSEELMDVPRLARADEWDDLDMIIQKYVCNEMTWNRRKFDVRIFWFVASLDPLIVLYHDGYVRIGNSDYTESDFSNTQAHLTTHTELGAEGKATFAQFADALQDLMQKKGISSFPAGKKAMDHVRNQMKHSLSEMIQIFKHTAFVPHRSLSTDNSFSLYCADFILDNDLDVWFLEPQYGCGLDEDYYFRLEMHASLFNGMVDVIEEVWEKQEAGRERLLPFKNAGNYEVVHADGISFYYDGYERNHNKPTCTGDGR